MRFSERCNASLIMNILLCTLKQVRLIAHQRALIYPKLLQRTYGCLTTVT